MELLYSIIFLAIGFGIGLSASVVLNRSKIKQLENQLLKQQTISDKQLFEKETRIAALEEKISMLSSDRENALRTNDELRNMVLEKSQEITRLTTEKEQLIQRMQEHNEELKNIQQKFTAEFENLANRIFRQQSADFMNASGKNLGELIAPLKERLQQFEQKVQAAYEMETRDKISLRQEVRNLVELNRKLSEDAENLTKALRGDVKKQGNWGEIVLERVLERSGLTKGSEYDMQFSTRSDDRQLIRPDVIIYLPERKHLIIDAKVSLNAYEQFVNCEEEAGKKRYIAQHVESIRNHVKGLAEKQYHLASDFDTPDFVLLFMPIESAFSAALQADPELFGFAWDRKIVIVSPTTLLATLKTVASMWKQEKQTQNALEIARQGGGLYDKFVSFLEDIDKLGKQLSTVQKTYDDAYKKLVSGSGNLISRAEKLRKLGAKSGKSLPDTYLLPDHDAESDEDNPTEISQ